MVAIIIVLSVVIVLLGGIITTQIKRQEATEELVHAVLDNTESVLKRLQTTNDILTELDTREMFSSDDDVGVAFRTIREAMIDTEEFITTIIESQQDNPDKNG